MNSLIFLKKKFARAIVYSKLGVYSNNNVLEIHKKFFLSDDVLGMFFKWNVTLIFLQNVLQP